jgi:thiamine transporter ThiT
MINKLIIFFSLFGSVSTLLCCALPVTLVSLGMGATFASLTSSIPGILWLVGHKDTLFVLTGVMLIVSYFLMKHGEKQACPIDPNQAEVCQESKGLSNKMFWVSVVTYFIGLLFSYVIPKVFYGM